MSKKKRELTRKIDSANDRLSSCYDFEIANNISHKMYNQIIINMMGELSKCDNEVACLLCLNEIRRVTDNISAALHSAIVNNEYAKFKSELGSQLIKLSWEQIS